MVEPYKPLYTAPEAAKILRINTNAVYDLMNRGRLPYLLLGSKKVRGSDLEKFIEKYPTEGGGEDAGSNAGGSPGAVRTGCDMADQ